MRFAVRRLTSAVVLTLQLVLATRGFVWMPEMSSSVVPVAAGCSAAAMPMHHEMAMPADAMPMADDANASSSDCTPADAPPCHDVGGCHSGAPCCAPTLTPSVEFDVDAPRINAGVAMRPRASFDRVVPPSAARRLPPATAPPAVA